MFAAVAAGSGRGGRDGGPDVPAQDHVSCQEDSSDANQGGARLPPLLRTR